MLSKTLRRWWNGPITEAQQQNAGQENVLATQENFERPTRLKTVPQRKTTSSVSSSSRYVSFRPPTRTSNEKTLYDLLEYPVWSNSSLITSGPSQGTFLWGSALTLGSGKREPQPTSEYRSWKCFRGFSGELCIQCPYESKFWGNCFFYELIIT